MKTESRKAVEPFLSAAAKAYLSRYDEMSDICFVFPNKRSKSFFLKSLSDNLGDRPMLAPEVLDISEFMTAVSGLEVAPRIDLLFRLYKVYAGLLGKNGMLGTDEDVAGFDRFAPWGEILIGDFNEVEQYCVDASALFANVRDYREIASNFLTEEQMKMIERYFGYRPDSGNVEGFWKSVWQDAPQDSDTPASTLRANFVELWRILPELFEGLIENLEADGLALQGTTFRVAMEKVCDRGRDVLPWSHLVIVGFNMLSTSEARMFDALLKLKDEDGEPFAEFFWDATGPVLSEDSPYKSQASKDIRRYMKRYPAPEWAADFIEASSTGEMPSNITIAAAPSNVAQTKIARKEIKAWIKENKDNNAVETPDRAVIVPDENLLLPLIHSLPADLTAVNLTMGYPLRFTAVSSFVFHLKRLQSRRIPFGDTTGYYHEDLRLFLAHPFIQVVVGTEKANRIISDIGKYHLRIVTPGWMSRQSELLAEMLAPIPADSTPQQTVDYIDGVLTMVDRALRTDSGGLRTINSKMEREQISTYREALVTLLNSIERHSVSMGYMSVFHLVDRLVAGEKVNFEGQPLRGLQIMGLLETRAIDFDRLIVLSMNDKVMPKRSRRRTFLPEALRRGYGLPSSSKAEELYAYYFYRLLSRAREVTLVYDARAGEGMRSGGKSRFLMQLEMLYAGDKVVTDNYSFNLDSRRETLQEIEKTPEVMALLEDFTKDKKEGRNLSPTALMAYCACQLKFYFRFVAGIGDDRAPADYIDDASQGQIVHYAMLNLYFPEGMQNEYLDKDRRILLTPDKIEGLLADRANTERVVTRAVNRIHYKAEKEKELDRPLTGTVAMVAERMVKQIESILRHDLQLARRGRLELAGGEVSGNEKWRAGESPEVNVRYSIDRVDFYNDRMRIVDYKTGHSGVVAKNFEDIFNGNSDAKYILQLLLYSHVLRDRLAGAGKDAPDLIEPVIYPSNTIASDGASSVNIEKENVMLRFGGDKGVSKMFLDRMEELLREIFDSNVPFRANENGSHCSYCAFKDLCGRETS